MTADHIGKATELMGELSEMYAYCQTTYSERNGDEMSNRLQYLSSYLSRSAEIMCEAREILDGKEGYWSEMAPPEMNATRFRGWLKGKVQTEQKIYNMAERLNASIVHLMDALRTQISRLKAERTFTN